MKTIFGRTDSGARVDGDSSTGFLAHIIIIIVVSCLLGQGCVCAPEAHDQEQARTEKLSRDSVGSASVFNAVTQIRIGQSDFEVDQKLTGLFVRNQDASVLQRFQHIVPYTNSPFVSEWQALWNEADGGRQSVFAVFDSTNKNNLVDALWCYHGVRPLVPGEYDRSLRSLKAGDSVAELYSRLGMEQCEYFREANGIWKVRFVYMAYPHRSFVIEADAGTGRITYIGDGTL